MEEEFVVDEVDDSNDSGRKGRYLVNDDVNIKSPFWRRTLPRRDLVCIVIGATIIFVVVLLFIVIAVAFGSSTDSSSSNGNQEPWISPRLPTTLNPQLYTMYLDANLDTKAVTGTVSMMVYVNSPTDHIIFHAKDINILEGSVSVSQMSSSVEISNQFNFSANDYYVISLRSQLRANKTVTIFMRFNYTLGDGLQGFYRSYYTTSSGEKIYVANTQFEALHARAAFPCFDEPNLKANFSIELTHPLGYSALSNMPTVKNSTIDSTKIATKFQTTYRMSTYLAAFVISNFKCSTPDSSSRIKVRVCSREDVFDSTSYALKVANIVINYYEKFFDVDYPLPKQDLVAVPDFSANAMENWGLIIYRESAIVYNKEANPASSQQRVAALIGHELAHQWFGNLVTMEWWNGLWLNEGFARYVEHIGVNAAEPTWLMFDQFFRTVQRAYDADALNWTRPVVIKETDNIEGLFESITYDKGASLIQMLREYLGDGNFTNGLKIYLKAHQYNNAKTSDLWNAFNQVSSDGVSINIIMDTWTKQMGYPVVTIGSSDGNMATVTQSRFLQYPLSVNESMASSPYNYIWTIPLDFITQNNPNKVIKQVFSNVEGAIQWRSSDGFIKANINQKGFYRVNYDIDNWQKIINHLMIPPDTRPQILSALDRAGLLEDVFALSSAGSLNITLAFDMSKYLTTEDDYIPWITGLRWFDKIASKLSLTGIYGKYKRYILSLLSDVTDEYSFDVGNLTHVEKLLQTEVLLAGFRYGDESIAKTGLNMFRNWMKNITNVIPPNLRQIVYEVAIAGGGETEWNFLFNWYLNTTNPYERNLCLIALSKSTQPWILNKYLQYALTPVIRFQDIGTVINSVSSNIHGRYLAWNFFRGNWNKLNFYKSSIIKSLTQLFVTELELQEVENFFKVYPDATQSTGLAVVQSIEVIKGNIKWLEVNQDVLENWLDSQLH